MSTDFNPVQTNEMPGVCIGAMSVVANNPVVTKSAEPYTVVGGNPARFIKRREFSR